VIAEGHGVGDHAGEPLLIMSPPLKTMAPRRFSWRK